MNDRTPYTYAVLRYVHDIAAGEFMNVGLVVWAADNCSIRAKFKPTYSRLKKAFPTLNGEAYKLRLRAIQARFDALRRQSEGQLAFDSGKKLDELLQAVLPKDDSSLQWSPPGSGLSKDLDATVASLYSRFVTKFDEPVSHERRKDDDVWREFKTSLDRRNLTRYLAPKTIESDDDEVRFEHAWKNGTWHCYEPLSLDLASASSIKEKAHKWLGQITSVREGHSEPFKVFFLLGKPREVELIQAYEQAQHILTKTPNAEVVDESEAEAFSERVASEIEEHRRAARNQ
jgi:hypothetical protein